MLAWLILLAAGAAIWRSGDQRAELATRERVSGSPLFQLSSCWHPEQQQANADVPSFHEIANKEGQSAGAIMAHIMLPKHPMPTIPLTKSELADLSAYILSLRQEE